MNIKDNSRNDYIVISNNFIKDKKLSLAAKGLFTIIQSIKNEKYDITKLLQRCNEDVTVVESSIKELIEKGYLVTDENNEEDLVVCCNPKDEIKTNKKEIKIKVEEKKEIEKDIEEIWSLYPRKEGKKSAYKSIEKSIKKGINVETIKNGVIGYCNKIKKDKTENKYIKMGSTFFNQECWQDYTKNAKSVPIKNKLEIPEENKVKYSKEEELKAKEFINEFLGGKIL